jgi:DNA-binding MarR family transcriptional regulator
MQNDSIAEIVEPLFSLKYVFFKSFDSSSLGHKLNKTQERVLMIVWHHANPPMCFLSHEAGLEKGSLTTVVDSLEALGLVLRERDEDDRRSFIIKPTPSGSRLAERINALFRDHLDSLFGQLTREERLEFERSAQSLARLIPRLSPHKEK